MRSILPLLLLAACGGTSPGEPLPEDERASLCGEVCAREAACDGAAEPGCEAECTEATGYMRGDVVEAAFECMLELACTADDDPCWEQAIDGAPATEAYQDFLVACQDWELRCEAGDQGCDDDLGRVFTDEVLRDVAACMGEPCAAVEACLEGALPDL